MFVLKVNSIDSSDVIGAPGLGLVHVGETVRVCLVATGQHPATLDALEDTLQPTLESFTTTESRRLFSDSAADMSRMRSVDSLLSEELVSPGPGPSPSLQPTKKARCSSWSKTRASPDCLAFTLPFTPQPVSDDACSVHCKLVVKVRQLRPVETDSQARFDVLVEDYLDSAFGSPSDAAQLCLADVETVEHSIILSNPLRINHQLRPSTSERCCLGLQLESSCDDPDHQLSVKRIDLSIAPTKGATQTGHRGSDLFQMTQLTRLPLPVEALEETTVEFVVDRCTVLPAGCQYKVKADLVVGIGMRTCLLSYESPFEPAKAFLAPHSDDFTVSFTSSRETVCLGDTFDVHIRIDNKTSNPYDLSLLFPLLPDHSLPCPVLQDDVEDVSADEAVAVLQARLAQLPCFVCLEAERPIGVLRARSLFECSVRFLAARPGRHSIHKVQLVERGSDKIVDFVNILQVTVLK